MKTRIPAAFALGLACALTPSLATPIAAQQEDLVTALSTIEKSLWEGWKSHDTSPFEKYLTDDAINVAAGGIQVGKEDMIEFMSKNPCDVKSFSFSDWDVHRITDDVAILTYKATQDATCGGEKVPANVIVTSVYVNHGGQWMAASYHETPASKAGM